MGLTLSQAGRILGNFKPEAKDHEAAVLLGRHGGEVRGGYKAEAARANGSLGGRPPKR